jgi:phosphoribosyl-ATP pyrophosphohydrolase
MNNTQSFKHFELLWAKIEERAISSSPKDSYVSFLLSKGAKECSKKLGEEAIETVIAATSKDKIETIKESSDLLFHLFVLWKSLNIFPDEIIKELKNRESMSGLEEKESRKKE